MDVNEHERLSSFKAYFLSILFWIGIIRLISFLDFTMSVRVGLLISFFFSSSLFSFHQKVTFHDMISVKNCSFGAKQ
jgi:hypothetical protein